MMRILHVISNLSPKSGGPTTLIHGLTKYQALVGAEVAVCTTEWGLNGDTLARDTRPRTEADGPEYHSFPFFTPFLISPAMIKWAWEHISKFDIVHVHGLYRFPVAYVPWLARRRGIPYMIRPHGSLDPNLYKQSQYSLLLKRVYERLFAFPNLNGASAIHYTTEEEAQRVGFLDLEARPVIVPNGIDWGRYVDLPQPGKFRRTLGISDETPLVLFLSRINFKKGLDLLVPAFARVLEAFPDAHLALAGPDNEGYGDRVWEWCKDHGVIDQVSFVGHLGPEDVDRAYVDADVFVLPSYTENFGIVVVEAMACGCPVVISDQVNIWREVDRAGAGLVTTLEIDNIATAICKVLSDPKSGEEMGRHGRVAAEKQYAWPRLVEQLMSVYKELIDENENTDYD